MSELIFLEPIFKERIWGGNRLATEFGYNIPNDKTGEAWVISAHKKGDCQVKNGIYKSLSLSQLWQQYPEIFNSSSNSAEFPLMVKIIDAAYDLSVQVHPNDEFAKVHENDLGKEECWYILDAEPNAEIIYGHTAKNKDELDSMIDNNQWGKLLVNTPAQKGAFFNVPTGTVHAIKKGLLILEVQQSSDTTYRLYDYDRRDDNGNLRELHLDKAKQVINVRHDNNTQQCKVIKSNNLITHMRLLQNNYFSVELIRNTSTNIINKSNQYWLASVISGNGQINNQEVRKGDSFIIPSAIQRIDLSGKIELVITYENHK